MFNVKIVNADQTSHQYVTVPYIEVKQEEPNSSRATEIRVVMPQGMFTVEYGSRVYIQSLGGAAQEYFVVRPKQEETTNE